MPDTIDFGAVRVGVIKDSVIVFRNMGNDTINILSQRFSDSEFALADTSQRSLRVAPASSQSVTIRFLPTDTNAVLCKDTIRGTGGTDLLVLRGKATPFVSYAALTIPDSVNFGTVKAGITKDTNILFKNTGSDTLKILSQTFSNPKFKLGNSSQSQLAIAPGARWSVDLQFAPSDTSVSFGYDTIRTAYKAYVLVLRGNSIQYSSIFLCAPKFIDVSLTGVISEDMICSFDFGASADLSQTQSQLYSFDAQSSWSDIDYRGDQVDWGSENTSVRLYLDSTRRIDSLIATYHFYEGQRGGENGTSSELLKLHGVQLQKSGKEYIFTALGSTLSNIVDSAYRICDGQIPSRNCMIDHPMTTIKGYTPGAQLSIVVQ